MRRARRSTSFPGRGCSLLRTAVFAALLLPLPAALGQPITIPGSGFWMGTNEPEPADCSPAGTCYYDDERPAHWVDVPSFQISPYEVTNEEYATFLNAVGVTTDADGNPYIDADDPQIRIHHDGSAWVTDSGWENHPMREVSWYGANAYCRWAGGRLPTEAEWEKAATWDQAASGSRKYPWGNSFTCGSGTYVSSWACNNPPGSGVTTKIVGSCPDGVSPYGLFDMAGNVWEWTMGGYVSYPDGPMTFADHSHEARRGGSWTNSDYNLRCAVRSPQPRYMTDDNLGFRVCYSTLEPSSPPIVIPPRTVYSEWVEDFNVATPMDQVYDWWGTGRSFIVDPVNGWMVAALQTSGTYPSGEYMAMIRRDTGTLFAPGDYVDITVRLRYERGDRDYARTSVGVAWGNTRTISPGGRGADENFGYPWFLVANNSDIPNTWHEVTLKQVQWGEGKFCIGFGLWGNLSNAATPPIMYQHRMWVDWVKVRHSAPTSPAADFNRDGDVDADDIAAFETCATAPGMSAAANCTDRDFDLDRDVDQADFAVVQQCLSGQGVSADLLCVPPFPEPAGHADFAADATSGYWPMTVQFTDLSAVPDAWAWYWEFGDGQSSTLQNPSHAYATPGSYTVRLTTTGAGGPVSREKFHYISVLAPYADFAADVRAGQPPLTVHFTDLSHVPGASAWYWQLGDGQTSSDRHPAHTYAATGEFTVRLTVTGPGGPIVAEKTSYIHVSDQPRVALIIGAPANAADTGVITHLESMNLVIDVYDDDPGNRPTGVQIAATHELVIISSTAAVGNLGAEFRYQAVPMVYWESYLSVNGREALADGYGTTSAAQIQVIDSAHPIMAGLSAGPVTVATSSTTFSRSSGPVAGGVRVLATAVSSSSYRTVMVAEPGAPLLDGGVAAHKRIFLFMYDNTWTVVNSTGKRIFTNAVNYALAP